MNDIDKIDCPYQLELEVYLLERKLYFKMLKKGIVWNSYVNNWTSIEDFQKDMRKNFAKFLIKLYHKENGKVINVYGQAIDSQKLKKIKTKEK